MNVPQFVNPKNSTKFIVTPPLRKTHGDEDVANYFTIRILRVEMMKRNPRKLKNRDKDLQHRRTSTEGSKGSTWLYGIHAVSKALDNAQRTIYRLVATRIGEEKLAPAGQSPVRAEIVDQDTLEALLPSGAVHQGVALLAAPLPSVALKDVIESAPDTACIIVLDQVTDPQNVGAIMRSAAAFGATAIVLQDRHAPPVTGALAKAASGAVESLPLVRVTNLSRALDVLKSSGYWCVGLDGEADISLPNVKLDGRVGLVMGSEDTGMRRLTAENCDALARLPTSQTFGTLNVSAASAAALYEVARSRKS
jgi:23S rRNA (guanosine2251-2'-O)-methyltransferase